jgi:hypothetical protein
LNANPRFFHNVLKLAETWYFVQASPNDPKAQRLPLPDTLLGELLRYVVSHEIGHTLGLRHNMKASSSYTVGQLRDPKFTEQYGNEASIMDYGRFNYVAQPEDKVTRLHPKVAPYDFFAIEWGYKQLPGTTPEADENDLNQIVARQSTNPQLRWGPGPEDPVSVNDPGQQTEDLGSDPIAATTLGLKNINRILTYLVSATVKPTEDYTLLSEMYDATLAQRDRELGHVTTMVGGFTETRTRVGQPGAKTASVYTPISPARQRQAVQFLLQNGLSTPTNLIRPEILNRIEPSGTSDRVLLSQARLLARLFSDTRLKRLSDFEARPDLKGTYTSADLTEDVRKGVFGELAGPQVAVNPYRRNLQRAMVDLMGLKLREGAPEYRAIARGALSDIKASAQLALPKTTDKTTRLHLTDIIQTVTRFLDPKSG